ncbi:MAG: ferritin family protein [Syntrophobacteraceae bacterium]
MMFNFNAAEVFQIAINIEENGKRFYDKALEIVDDQAVKELFMDLGLQEVDHKKRFETLKAQLPPEVQKSTVWDPDNETDLYIKMMADQHVFTAADSVEKALATVKNSGDALKMAIEFEKDSVLFFLSLLEVTESKKDQEFINLLVKEEQTHLRKLSLELARLKRG